MLKRPAGTGLAATYEGGDPRLLERLVPLVDYIEISPDSISRETTDGLVLDAGTMAELEASGARFLVHGVGLSIASADGMSESYLRILDAVFERLPVEWHSEHLAYTTVGGENLGTMLPPPRTEEALDLICERATALRARYAVPFLLEHVVRILPDCPAPCSDAGFLNAVAYRSGCELIFDAYNIECDRENFGFDADGFVEELDFSRVREIHVAGGGWHRGFRMDVHSRRADEATRARTLDALGRAPHAGAVTFEFLKQAVPGLGHEAICAELASLREVLVDAGPR